MNSRRSSLITILVILFGILLLGGLVWFGAQLAKQDLGGGRFWIEWISARARLVDGLSPYSAAVSERIQQRVDNLFSWAPGHTPHFTSPVYATIVSLPFVFVPDPVWAHAAWMVAQAVLVLVTLLAYTRLVAWKPAWWVYALICILILLSLRAVITWLEGSLVIWVAALIAAFFLALRGRRYELAGICLALTMIMPQAVILFVLYALIWAALQRKAAVIVWFFSTLFLLSLAGLLLVPDWLIEYLRILWNFSSNFGSGTPGYAFQSWWPGLGRQLGWVLTTLLVLILLVEWRLSLRHDTRWFLWTASLTLTFSPWIGIPSSPEAHWLLTLPLLLVLAMFEERWKHSAKWVGLIGVGLIFVWEWSLFLGSVSGGEPAMRLGLIFPLPLLLLIGLFWVRWWAIRPKSLLIDELRASEML